MMMINFTHLEEILAILIFFFITFFFALNLRRVKHVRREVSEKRKSSMLREKGNGTLLINFSLFCTLLLILFFSLLFLISRTNKVINHQIEKFFFN